MGRQDSCRFADEGLPIVQVLDDLEGGNDVHRTVGKGQASTVGVDQSHFRV